MFGIFIEPTGELLQKIDELKRRVERNYPCQRFNSHPPHSTLIYGSYLFSTQWKLELAVALEYIQSFRVDAVGCGVFFDDVNAGGGHTVIIKAQPTINLFRLQQVCGEVVKKYKKAEQSSAKYFSDSEQCRNSYLEYGYPFIGSHWIPHFTIASLEVARNSRFLYEMLSGEAKYSFELDKISVWEVGGDIHTKMFDVHFGG